MTKYCPKCGNQIKDTAKFCPKCGADITELSKQVSEVQLPKYQDKNSIIDEIPKKTEEIKNNKTVKKINHANDTINDKWNNLDKTGKIITGVILCCVACLIIGGIMAIITPDANTNTTVITDNNTPVNNTTISNTSTVTNNSKDLPDGVEAITIQSMNKEEANSQSLKENVADQTGFTYTRTLIPENKNIIVKLYDSDWSTINSLTDNNPEGKTIYVKLVHDDFMEQWNGRDFYYIEGYYDSNGNYISG